MTSNTTMEGMTDSIVSYKLELTGQVAAGQIQPSEMNEALDTNRTYQGIRLYGSAGYGYALGCGWYYRANE